MTTSTVQIDFRQGIKIIGVKVVSHIPCVGDLVDFNDGTCYKVVSRKFTYGLYGIQRVDISLETFYTY